MMKLNDITIYEDDSIIVINKPAGISVHGDGKTTIITLTDLILGAYPEIKDVGEPMEFKGTTQTLRIDRPGIVHRLDKDTSGVLVIAKSQASFLFLKDAFKDRTTEKEYRAFVYGWPKGINQTIIASISRAKGDIRKWSVAGRGMERDAETYLEVRKKFMLGDLGTTIAEDSEAGSTEKDSYSYLYLKPKTGRTHQLRVHLRSINHPIVCDTLYAPARESALGFSRLALHAYSLTIPRPDGTKKSFIAPFPDDFKSALSLAGILES